MNRSTRNNSNHGHGNRHMTGRILALLLALSMTVSLGVDVSSLQAYATNNDGVIENVENQEGNDGSDEDAAPTDLTDGDDNEVPDDEPQETTEAGNTGDNGDDNHDADAQEPSDEQDETDDSNKEENGETKTDEDANKDQSADDKADSKDDDADNKDEESDELDEIVTPDARFDVEDDETIPNDDYDADYIEAADDAVDSENKLASLIAVAQSQVGYTQQIQDDTESTVYTLYGKSYDSDQTYDDWSAVFAAYCLDKAGFDVTKDEIEDESTALPIRDSLSTWEDAMDDAGWYMTSAAGVSLTAGDIAFLDLDQDGDADHIGIITSVEGDENEPTTSFRAVIGDLDADTKANYYEVSDEEKSAAPSVQEISFPGDREDVDDAASYIESLVSGYVTVASYLDFVENGNNGADEPETIPDGESNDAVDFKSQITSAKMYRLVNGYWVETKTFEDGDQVKVDIEYAFADPSKVTQGTKITYQLPDGCVPNDTLSGIVTGTIGNKEYANLGTYTIDKNGLITIEFNETFHQTSDSFTGTIEFQGTAENSSTTKDKEVNFTEQGEGYIIKKRKIDNDLSIKKKGNKKASDTAAEYTVVVSSVNGTENDSVKIIDTVYITGLKMDEVKYQNIKVVDKDGNPVTVNDSQISYGSGDNYKTLTITELPALPAGGSYTITYEIDYGATIGNGEGILNNNVHGYKGNEDKGNSSAYIVVAQKMIEKSGVATDNNGYVKWTITVNPNLAADVAGTYSLKDELNGSAIDWSKVEDFQIEVLDGATWQTTTYNKDSALAQQIMGGNITIENRKKYTITYKTKVSGSAGQSITQKNKTDIGGWSGEGEIVITKPDWKVGKTGTGVTEDEGSETATAGWTSTIALPIIDAETGKTGFTADSDGVGFVFKDTITDNDGNRNTNIHYTTKSLLENTLEIKLDNNNYTNYELICYDASGNKVTDSDEKITYFEVKVKGSAEGSTMTFSYDTKMVIKDLGDGEALTVKNTSEVNGKVDSATQTYKKKKDINKASSGTAFSTPIVDSVGRTNLNYNLIYDEATKTYKIYYRIVIYPNSEKGSTLIDEMDEGLTYDQNSVKIQYTSGAHNIWTASWYNGFYFDYEANKGLQASVSFEGQKMTINFPDVSEVKDTSSNQREMPAGTFDGTLGYVIDYTVTLTDEDWNKGATKSKVYKNIAKWNGKTTTQETEIYRPSEEIAKAGEQEIIQDSKTGTTSRSNTIKYYVTINAAGDMLNEGRDIKLTDNLANNSYGIKLQLDLTSVKLYKYDPTNRENHFLGDQMSQNSYTFVYDDTTKSFTAGIPDATACVLVYDYTVTDWNGYANVAKIINNVTLIGKDKKSEQSETNIQAADSSATVKKANTLKLIKVDSEHYQTVLPNAVFELYAYDATTHAWNRMFSNKTLQSDGNGELVFDSDPQGSGTAGMPTDTLYKLIETKAPEGYSLPSTYTPYYFVMLGDGTTSSSFWSGLGTVNDSDPKDSSTTKTVASSEVTFVEHKGAGTIYAPNRYSSIQVNKKWVDEKGEETEPLRDSIRVQLYQQTTSKDTKNVTVNTWFSYDKSRGIDDVDTRNYPVYRGNDLVVWIRDHNIDSITVYVDGVEMATVPRTTDGSGEAKYTVSNITANTTVNVVIHTENASNPFGGWDGWKTNGYTISTYYTGDSSYIEASSQPYGDPKTLNSANGWSATWTDLPVTNSETQTPYYYYVKEVGETDGQVEEGWTVTYDNNNGIQTGVIEITNHVVKRYTMPETGGTGTLPYEAAGSIAILGAMFYTGYSRRKRKGGQV